MRVGRGVFGWVLFVGLAIMLFMLFSQNRRTYHEIDFTVFTTQLKADKVNEKTIAKYLYHPEIPEVDMFLRPSGEQRTSNFLLWQSAYAEMVYLDTLWPDFDRRHLWYACELFAQRDRRFGGALPNPVSPT